MDPVSNRTCNRRETILWRNRKLESISRLYRSALGSVGEWRPDMYAMLIYVGKESEPGSLEKRVRSWIFFALILTELHGGKSPGKKVESIPCPSSQSHVRREPRFAANASLHHFSSSRIQTLRLPGLPNMCPSPSIITNFTFPPLSLMSL
jgi:hypothetical protein